jgi:hypothetical protein
MPSAGFKPAIPAFKRLLTYAFNRVTIQIGFLSPYGYVIL